MNFHIQIHFQLKYFNNNFFFSFGEGVGRVPKRWRVIFYVDCCG